MPVRGILISDDIDYPIPAVGCVRELDNVIVDSLQWERCCPFRGEFPSLKKYDVSIYTALDYRELVELIKKSGPAAASDIKLAYLFDAFLPNRLLKLPKKVIGLTNYARTLRRLDAIYSPMNGLCDEQSDILKVEHRFLPIGVDCLRYGSGGHTDKRWIQVNAYGRQPKRLTDALSDAFNHAPGGFFYHTDHMQIRCVNDADRHRALFWQTLRSSKISVAYAPEACDPAGRFQCSFVGQRWFESLAAGCVIVGKAPVAPETKQLFDWDDATIELPDESQAIIDVISDILGDEERLELLSCRNYANCLSQHDWRHRLKVIVDEKIPELSASANRAVSETFRLSERVSDSVMDQKAGRA